MVENLQTGSPTKFADLKFADSHISEICGIAIADSAQKFADLKKNMRSHLCKFATGVNDTCGKFLNKIETALTRYSGAWGKLIHEKNLK